MYELCITVNVTKHECGRANIRHATPHIERKQARYFLDATHINLVCEIVLMNRTLITIIYLDILKMSNVGRVLF